MRLDNTIILPGDNIELSKRLLISLIEKEDVVTIIIFGTNEGSEKAVQKADLRASGVMSGIKRKVAWMQDVELISFLNTLIKSGSGGNPTDIDTQHHIGVSISMTDVLKDIISINPEPDFIRIEQSFIKASKI